ncbi:TMV resistance protein Y3 [Coprinopsis sp. MPI-PUGE-AT-0042]|nr:TMV resistance protein Y3 [Coprinopsis sp. MPI-PUGE-AT-0042]
MPSRSNILFAAVLAMSGGNALAQIAIQCLPQSDFAADCSRFIDAFCEVASAHKHTPFDSVSKCFGNAGSKCDFTAWSKSPLDPEDASPSLTRCKQALRTVATTCPSGGHAQFEPGIFQFSINPNRGQCGGYTGTCSLNEEAASLTAA